MALTLSDVKFWEAMGEEISIHTAFFVWHLKIALSSFYGIPTNASIFFSTFRATISRSSEVKCKFVSSNVPQGLSCLILNFPRTRHIKELLWCDQPGVTYFLQELYFHDRGRLIFNVGFVEIYFTGWLNLNYLAWRVLEPVWSIQVSPLIALHVSAVLFCFVRSSRQDFHITPDICYAYSSLFNYTIA